MFRKSVSKTSKDYNMVIFKLLRVKQWVKNLFVFLPAIFSGQLLNAETFLHTLEAFFVFCLISSTIYILNDICDRKADREHPRKRLRPIASGKVSVGLASVIAVVIFVAAFALAWLFFGMNVDVFLIAAGYVIMNIAYTLTLKNIAILDVIIIATGFVLRVLMGGAACGIWVSPWLVMMVFLLTLLIAFGKRRDDLIRAATDGKKIRKSVTGYNITFINQVISLLAGTMIVAYVCYTLSNDVMTRFASQNVYLTSVFVIAAVLRYLQLIYVREESGSPTDIIYRDRFIQSCCVLWLLSFIFIIYR